MRTSGGRLMAAALACAVTAAVCRSPAARDPGGSRPGASARTGVVTVDGSSTVLPVSRSLAADFQRVNAGVSIEIAESGTGGGFEKLCRGAVDLIGASRPIEAAEQRGCEANGVAFIEVPIAFDSLTVVVNAKNTFADCLTVAELKRMWEPAAQGTIDRWDQIRPSFPAQPLDPFRPGSGLRHVRLLHPRCRRHRGAEPPRLQEQRRRSGPRRRDHSGSERPRLLRLCLLSREQ